MSPFNARAAGGLTFRERGVSSVLVHDLKHLAEFKDSPDLDPFLNDGCYRRNVGLFQKGQAVRGIVFSLVVGIGILYWCLWVAAAFWVIYPTSLGAEKGVPLLLVDNGPNVLFVSLVAKADSRAPDLLKFREAIYSRLTPSGRRGGPPGPPAEPVGLEAFVLKHRDGNDVAQQ